MAKRRSLPATGAGPSDRPSSVHQFLIVLSETEPLVWRRIQVPQAYTFWDLHVAIQDAMGWLDCHLHEFRIVAASGRRVVSIGIPADDEPEDHRVEPGWRVPLDDYFEHRHWNAPPALYLYDFGDNWRHVVVHEGMQPVEAARAYPHCVSGARRCPPEDCGGSSGFAAFLEAIADPAHPQHDDLLGWAGGTFDARAFDPTAVSFADPARRWRKAFA
jgi:hypothetical protein